MRSRYSPPTLNPLLDAKILGWLLVGLGVVQIVPMLAALLYGEAYMAFAASAITALVIGLCLALTSPPSRRDLRLRDSFAIVAMSWVAASAFGCLPFILTGALEPVDALFESVSGFTTTGATVMSGLDTQPKSILLWRAISQWIGGMGIIVFAVAIVPLLGIGGMQLLKTEVAGPRVDKLQPRIAATAQRLLLIYIAFTAAQSLALWIAGMSLFDAVCHALTTLSTAGHSTRDGSIGAFDSAWIEWIVIFFMLLGGINFALHYRWMTGNFRRVLGDLELRYFLVVLIAAALFLVGILMSEEPGGEGHVRRVAFQVVSLATTTGFTSDNYAAWPTVCSVVLFQLAILGGMAGSTSGGLKGLRVLLGFAMLRNTLARMLHPRAVPTVKYGEQTVPMEVVAGVWSFFTAYFALVVVAACVVAFAGYDLLTAATAALSAVGNIGPGLGAVGPTENFGHMPGYVKLVLSFCMIAGRLELFTVLVLFLPAFWRR